MKILAIGDPHGELKKIKKIPTRNIDLILLTGDLGSAGLMRKMAFENIERKKQGLPEKEYAPQQEKRAFMEAYDSTMKLIEYLSRYAPVYTIFGNVESSNYETKKKSREIGLKLPFLYNQLNFMPKVKVVNNIIAKFNGIRIGGLKYFIDTNWVREFNPSEFKKRMSEAKEQTNKAKEILSRFGYVDILLCHQPPYKILDQVTSKNAPKHWQRKHARSPIILNYINKNSPRYAFCGHIHEAKGMKKIGNTEIYNLGIAEHKIIEL